MTEPTHEREIRQGRPILRVLVRASLAALTCAGLTAVAVPLADADVPPAFSFNDIALQEPAPGQTTQMVFTATLDAPSTTEVTVTYRLYNMVGLTAYDWSVNQTLTFAPGETSKPAPFELANDPYDAHPAHTYEVRLLEEPTNATVADGVGVATVLDNTRDGWVQCFSQSYATDLLVASPGVPGDSWCNTGERRYLTNMSDDGALDRHVILESAESNPTDWLGTLPQPGDHARVHTELGYVLYELPGLTIEATNLVSDAALTCPTVGPLPELTGSSRVGGITITVTRTVGGLPVSHSTHLGPITDERVINLPDGGTITLNDQDLQRKIYPWAPDDPTGWVVQSAISVRPSGNPYAARLAASQVRYVDGNPCTA
jgi:hypothetical protein